MGLFTVWMGIFPSIGILAFILYWRRVARSHQHIPGPPQKLLTGNFKELRKLSTNRGLTFQLILKHWQDVYGDLFVFRVFHMSMVVVADPKEIKRLLSDGDKFPKSKRYEEFHSLYGTRLIPQSILVEQNHTAWAMKRRLLNVFFKRNAIDEYLVCFDEAAGRLMSRIQSQMDLVTDGEPISLYPLLTETALDSVLRALFNIKLDRYKGFAEKVGKLFPALQAQLRSPLRRIFPGKNEKRMARMLEEIRQTCRDIINDNLVNNGQGQNTSINLCALSQSENRHYDDMVDEVLVMVMAGTDSTANTLGFLVKEMCNYAPYQDRMSGEILKAMDGNEKVATRNFLSKLVFTQQMINETLRKYPTVCGTTRTCKEDTVISGIKIPANTVIMISTYLLHHNKKYWKNPSLFDPERFAASDMKNKELDSTSSKSEGSAAEDATEQEVNAKRNCFLPFSKGQRVCIGANFAKMEMQIVMARLLSQFHVECLSTSDDFNEALALRPGDSVPVRLTKLVKH